MGITIICFLGPFFINFPYDKTQLELGATAPSLKHPFGTDTLGRDLLVRTLIGGQISILVGFLATFISLVIGVIFGMISGFSGKKTDACMMRFVDTLYALPFTIIIILLTVLFGRGLVLIFIAIGALEWLTLARIVRGETRNIRAKPYVEAATLIGLSKFKILSKHILPNLISPVIASFIPLTIPSVILLESVISFLGLGVQAPMTSWGSLINEGAQKFDIYPWLLIFPALFSLTILSLNFIGDALRDQLIS